MTDPGCPRCRDYEQLKRELDNQKEHLKEKQNKELLSCEKEKKLLQKKVLQYGAVAVIGGTILGKEFVDNVASYVESFGAVTNVMPNIPVDMVSSVSPAANTPSSDPQDPTPSTTQTAQNKNSIPLDYFYTAAVGSYLNDFGNTVSYGDPLLDYTLNFDSFSENESE